MLNDFASTSEEGALEFEWQYNAVDEDGNYSIECTPDDACRCGNNPNCPHL